MCSGCMFRVTRSRRPRHPWIGMTRFPVAVDGSTFARPLVLAPAIEHTKHVATNERCLDRHCYLLPQVRPGVRTGPCRHRCRKVVRLPRVPALSANERPAAPTQCEGCGRVLRAGPRTLCYTCITGGSGL